MTGREDDGAPCAHGCGLRFRVGWAAMALAAQAFHDPFCPDNPGGVDAVVSRARSAMPPPPTLAEALAGVSDA